MTITWPESGWCLAAIAVYLGARRGRAIWARALASTALQAALGFGLVSISLLVVNKVFTGGDVAGVTGYELWLLHMSGRAVPWLRLPWWVVLILLFAAACLVHRRPRTKAVTRLLAARRIAGIAAGAVALATSFSFFTDDALFARKGDETRQHIAVVYTEKRGQERERLGRYLAARALSEEARRPSPVVQRIAATVAAVASRQWRTVDAPRQLVDQLLGVKRLSLADARVAATRMFESSELVPDPQALASDPVGLLRDQDAKADAMAALAAAEEQDAFEALLNTGVGAGSESARAIVKEFVSRLIQIDASPFSTELTQYLDRVGDKAFDTLTAPTVRRIAERMRAHFDRMFERPADASGDVTPSLVRELAVDRVAEELAGAERAIADMTATDASHAAIVLADREATARKLEAKELWTTFAPLAAGSPPGLPSGGVQPQVDLTARYARVAAELESAERRLAPRIPEIRVPSPGGDDTLEGKRVVDRIRD